MINIINLTQHRRTEDQDGVFDITNEEIRAKMKAALTFTTLPTAEEIEARADTLVSIAVAADASAAMIGGAPYLMGTLERKLLEAGIKPLYSFTCQETTEEERTVDHYNDADSLRRGYRHSCRGYDVRTRRGYGRNCSGDCRNDSYNCRRYGRCGRGYPERDRDGEVTKTSINKHLGWVEVSK